MDTDLRRFTEAHEWARVLPDSRIEIGITDHGQSLMGDLVFVEAPAVGRVVAAGEACGVLESVKAAADLHAPVGGRVDEVNAAVPDRPERLNEAAETTWIFRVQPTDAAADLERLLDARAYTALVAAA
jgi:glycine cleavage system H protein